MKKNPHRPTGKVGRKGALGYAYCIKCGLVYLNNEATKKAIKLNCESDLND